MHISRVWNKVEIIVLYHLEFKKCGPKAVEGSGNFIADFMNKDTSWGPLVRCIA